MSETVDGARDLKNRLEQSRASLTGKSFERIVQKLFEFVGIPSEVVIRGDKKYNLDRIDRVVPDKQTAVNSTYKDAEFEQLTRKIFDLMGFETRKMKILKAGGGTPESDGLILNAETGTSGLLECNGGTKYTFPIGDCRKMERTYI